MSVATEFAPVVYIPERARQPEPRLASVLTLHRPGEQSVAAPLRLTQRGVAALAAAVAALGMSLVFIAWLSAPQTPAIRPPAMVTVQAGDTLWSIATRVAPDRDPRAEVSNLQRINHLAGVELAAGQILRTG